METFQEDGEVLFVLLCRKQSLRTNKINFAWQIKAHFFSAEKLAFTSDQIVG